MYYLPVRLFENPSFVPSTEYRVGIVLSCLAACRQPGPWALDEGLIIEARMLLGRLVRDHW